MENCYENNAARFRVENDVLHVEVKPNTILDLTTAASIVSGRMDLQHGREFLIFFDINGISDSDKDGRDYLAAYGWPLAKAVGIYAKPGIALMIANFYLRISKPAVPTQIFIDRQAALEFLESHS